MSGPIPGGVNWGFELEIDIDSDHLDKTLQTLMSRMQFGLQDFLQNNVLYYLQFRTAGRFSSEGDAASGPWAPLKPATEAIRRSKGYGGAHPINVRTGRLRDYLLQDRGDIQSAGTAGWKLTYPGGSTDMETRDKLQTAQRGKPFPNTVERPVIALGVEDYNAILEDLSAFMVKDLM